MNYDVVRYLDFAMFGVGFAFMLITNILAFKILRSPRRFGFLWWHVTSISVSFVCIGSVALDSAFSRLGEDPTWRTPLIFVGFLLFMISQMIIFTVELERYAARTAYNNSIAEEL